MATKSNTSREAKAQELLNSGAVSLYVGQGYALVQGSGSNVYRVTKDGCTCPDATGRGAVCKHELAVRTLCQEYRRLKAAAARGEVVRPTSALIQALDWQFKPAPCRTCGRPTVHDECADCFLGHVPTAGVA